MFVVGTAVVGLGGVAAARFDELGCSAAKTWPRSWPGIPVRCRGDRVGLGAFVRRTAGTLAILVLLLLVIPEILALVARRLDAPGSGRSATTRPAQRGSWFIAGDWEWGLVLAGWSLAALAIGVWACRSRDG